jgi:hypothetical protein
MTTATEWAERLEGFARYARTPRVNGGDPVVYELTAKEAAALAALLRAMVAEGESKDRLITAMSIGRKGGSEFQAMLAATEARRRAEGE